MFRVCGWFWCIILLICGVQAPAAKPAAKPAARKWKEVVLAAHNGDTERLRALLEANRNLVDSVRRAKFALLLAEMKPRAEPPRPSLPVRLSLDLSAP